jgi:hypothetical protein
MEWTYKLENIAKQIENDSKKYKLMHIFQSRKYHIIYNALSITGIILGPVAGLLSAIEAVLYPEENHILPILVCVLSTISGIIAAAVKFGNYDVKSQSNKSVAARYTSIENNIRRQLNIDKEHRVPVSQYLKWLESKYEELQTSAPMIEPAIFNKFRNPEKDLELKNYPLEIEIDVNEKISELTNSEEKEEEGNLTLKRSSVTNNIFELSECSDKMLKYELKRMMGF